MRKGYRINESVIKDNGLLDSEYNPQNIRDEISILDYVQVINGQVEIDGSRLMNDWFPLQKKKNVFVSQSHGDFSLVKGFAGHLDNLGLNAFVDATVWGNINDLIATINHKYNEIPGESDTFYYDVDHVIASNVYMLLIRALNRMIDQCDTFIFIDSNNSTKNGNTYSPWIMQELEFQNILANMLRFSSTTIEKRRIYDESISVQFTHDVQHDLQELTPIDNKDEFSKMIVTIRGTNTNNE